jgi:GNAT superfamily N-acetyltransferase
LLIRPASPSELDAIAELYCTVWHETHGALMPDLERQGRTLAFFLDRMLQLLQTTLVGHRRGRIAGFASWRGDYLGQLFVRAEYRGFGIANELLSAAERSMATAGTAASELHCLVGNDRAHRFYIRNGWSSDGIITEKLADSRGYVDVPFWRMTKRLK